MGAIGCTLNMSVTQALASDAFNGITGKPSGNDVFGGVTNVAKDVGNSAINLFTVGGAILVVVAIILVGIALIFFKGDQEVTKNKKHLLVIIGGTCLIFGAIGIGSGMANIGASIGDSFQDNSSGNGASDTNASPTTGSVDDSMLDTELLAGIGNTYKISLTEGDGVA